MSNKKKQRGGSGNNNLTGSIPDLFSNDFAKVEGVGCAGTRSGSDAANSQYVPYTQAGGAVCLQETPMTLNAGRAAGYPSVMACKTFDGTRSLSMLGGKKKTRTLQKKSRKNRKGRIKSAARRSKARKSAARRSKARRSAARRSKARRSKARKSRQRRNKSKARRNKTRKHKKYHMSGGSGGVQPYSNQSYGTGYSTTGVHLNSNLSALANPAPHSAYASCNEQPML